MKSSSVHKKICLLKIHLYFISNIPLFIFSVILLFKLKDADGKWLEGLEILKNNIVTIIFIIAVIVGFIFVMCIKNRLRSSFNPKCSISYIKNRDRDSLEFLLTNIIPLLSFLFSGCKGYIVFFGLIILIGLVTIKCNLYIANPILSLFGYKFYEIRIKENNRSATVITKDILKMNDEIIWLALGDDNWFVKKV